MKMMTLTEAIETRHSVRTFDGVGLTAAERQSVTDAIAATSAPFGGKWRAALASESEATDFRPSTYGMIRGARDFILVGYADDEASKLSAGFAVERAVLEAVRVGVSSCWIGATFRHTRFETAAQFPAESPLKIVIALGRARKRRSLVDSVAHFMAGSSRRRTFDRTFFNESVLYPVETTSPFYEPLRLMSLAPSSVNSQPWRAIVREGSIVDFFSAKESQFSDIDMGIGLSHFAIGCEAAAIEGSCRKLDSHADGGEWRYITSFVQSRD